MAPPKKARDCPTCGRTFTKPDHLQRHIRSHTQEKPYTCTTCGKSFGRQDVLTRHVKSHERKANDGGQPVASTSQQPIPAAAGYIPVTQPAPPPMQANANIDPQLNAPAQSIHHPSYATTLPALDPRFWANVDVSWSSTAAQQLVQRNAGPAPHSPVGSAWDRLAATWGKIAPLSLSTPSPPFVDGGPLWQTSWYILNSGIDLSPMVPPTSDFVSQAIDHYFQSYAHALPFVTQATFVPAERPTALVLAIAATGAGAMGTLTAQRFAEQVFGRVAIGLQRTWGDPTVPQLDLVRAALLVQAFCFASARPQLVAAAMTMQTAIVASARRLDLFSPTGPCADLSHELHSVAALQGDQLQSMWKRWLAGEEARRIVLAIYAHETYIHVQRKGASAPALAPATTQTYLSSAEPTLTDATDAANWQTRVMAAQPSAQLTLLNSLAYLFATADDPPAYGIGHVTYNVVTLKTILHGFNQQRASRALNKLPTREMPMFDSTAIIALERWRRTFLARIKVGDSPAERWQMAELLTCYHSLLMNEIIPHDLVETASGREGGHRVQEAQAQLQRYADSPLLRRCLLYASQILLYYHNDTPLHYTGFETSLYAFRAALLFAAFPSPPPSADIAPLDLATPIDWDRMGVATVSEPNGLDQMVFPAARWIVNGGVWHWRDMADVKEVLLATAGRMETLAKQGVVPSNAILAEMLRTRAEVV